MVMEDFAVEQYFTQVRIKELPEHIRPKFRIGDLVRIVFRSNDGPASYELKDSIAVVCEIFFYKCTNYDWEEIEDRDPFYIIEYKVMPSSEIYEFRYVSEENLRKVTND